MALWSRISHGVGDGTSSQSQESWRWLLPCQRPEMTQARWAGGGAGVAGSIPCRPISAPSEKNSGPGLFCSQSVSPKRLFNRGVEQAHAGVT